MVLLAIFAVLLTVFSTVLSVFAALRSVFSDVFTSLPRRRYPLALATILLIASLVPLGIAPGSGATGTAALVVEVLGVGLDAWLHAIGYGVLAATLVLIADRLSWPSLFGAVVIATVLGAGIELVQWPLPWRTGSLFDALANATGATVGAGLAGFVRAHREQSQRGR